MGSRFLLLLSAAVISFAATSTTQALAESIDGRVVVVDFPFEDFHLEWVESKGSFSIHVKAKSVYVSGHKFYVGDGTVAVRLESDNRRGIVFQGQTELDHGYKFKKGEIITLLPGYKQAADLKPGDTYLILPLVFKEAKK
ncbi:hypothetical protein ETAA8_50050 [Anatilimnocola aggregata]|uniref:Uncharacterized protein n=1 Tax=Anatilimnocola aggregata TaxID=2528021 RepID=A0A517YI48_9BACT|nr:hypothetical protein [Anatilimnocola aggregata]QDU29889.1 hypothetical protein ETAA8_50050 [Anatilimnocola aggregata]